MCRNFSIISLTKILVYYGDSNNRVYIWLDYNRGNTVGNTYEMATLGGGCFWCLEAVYLEVNGITEIVSGYTGGSIPEPSYEDICTGNTGHAEVVQLKFDLNEHFEY